MGTRILVAMLFPSIASAGMKLTAPPSQLAMKGSYTILPCIFDLEGPVEDFFLAVVWYFNDTEVLVNHPHNYNDRRPEMSLHLSEVKMGNASLWISGVKLSHSGRYKCSVTHNLENQERDIELTVQAQPTLKVYSKIVRPYEENMLHCLVTGFYPPNISVAWLRGSEVIETFVTRRVKRQEDGTFNVNSTAIIIHTEEAMNETFTCQVRHESNPSPLQERFLLVYEEPQDCAKKTASAIVISVLYVLIVLICLTCAIFFLWKKRREAVQAKTREIVTGNTRRNRAAQSASTSAQPTPKTGNCANRLLGGQGNSGSVGEDEEGIEGSALISQKPSEIAKETQEQLHPKSNPSTLPRTALEPPSKPHLKPSQQPAILPPQMPQQVSVECILESPE